MVITPLPEPLVLITTNSKLLPTLALDTTASRSVAKGSVYAAAVVVGVPKMIPFSNWAVVSVAVTVAVAGVAWVYTLSLHNAVQRPSAIASFHCAIVLGSTSGGDGHQAL